jgi:uncharacterized integral membrane protein
MSVPTNPPGAGSPEPHSPTPGREPQPRQAPASPHAAATTRAAAAWFATAAALVLLVLLVILMLQNRQPVEVRYIGFTGSLPLGTALLVAAVGGAAVVTIVGVVRLTQLRIGARRARRLEAKPGTTL